MDGLEIKKAPFIDIKGKGKTIEWCKGILGKQVTIFYRKKGTPFGEHYHKGDDPSKNPERFLVVKGKMKLWAKNPSGEIFEGELSEGEEVFISPGIFHKAEASEDLIFIEYRKTEYNSNKSDTYGANEYGTI